MKNLSLAVWSILVILMCSSTLSAHKRSLSVVYIGDSITFGAWLDDVTTQAPPVKASAYLKKRLGVDTVEFSNQGHSGFTTVDFLPGTVAFSGVEKAASMFANKSGMLCFSIMLGTNDSAMEGTNGAPVSPIAYYRNMKNIIDQLLIDYPGCVVVVNCPLWYSPNTYNGAQYLQEGLNRLQSYFKPIKELVKSYHNNQVFLGNTTAFQYFKNNYLTKLKAESGHEGTFYLHPNKEGAEDLGIFWGEAIYAALEKQ